MPFYILVISLLVILGAAAAQPSAQQPEPHYVISDESGNILSTVSVTVTPGDEFLTAQNELYLITAVEHQLAHAKFVRHIYPR